MPQFKGKAVIEFETTADNKNLAMYNFTEWAKRNKLEVIVKPTMEVQDATSDQ